MQHIRGRKLLLGLFITLLASATLPAEDANSQWLACAKLGDNSERLSCFDQLVARLNPDPKRSLSQAPVSTAAPDMFGAAPSPKVPAPVGVTRTEISSITAHVTQVHENRNGAVSLDLDNGQRWEQVGHEELLLKVGEQVKITRGAFRSFWIVSESNRSSHVRRKL